ncbi:hypothetical protein H4582DRAFT_2079485 [Lactarius indigo]|nr:hypothetical protein H4582DRAFT_2079485 [Lactarius indigo]
MEADRGNPPVARKGIREVASVALGAGGSVGCSALLACLTDEEQLRSPEDEVALSADSGKVHRTAPHCASFTAASKKKTYASPGEGPVKPVAGLERIGPSTARKGNPHVASVVCLVPAGDPNPPAAGGAVHTSRQLSDSGDGFLTVGTKARSRGRLTFGGVASNVMANLQACFRIEEFRTQGGGLVAGLANQLGASVAFTPVFADIGLFTNDLDAPSGCLTRPVAEILR